jgi:hypothetical protein
MAAQMPVAAEAADDYTVLPAAPSRTMLDSWLDE